MLEMASSSTDQQFRERTGSMTEKTWIPTAAGCAGDHRGVHRAAGQRDPMAKNASAQVAL